MTEETKGKPIVVNQNGGGGAVYGIGVFGAWAYYFKTATTNEERVKAFAKGLFWPAFVVHDLMVFLGKDEPRPEAD